MALTDADLGRRVTMGIRPVYVETEGGTLPAIVEYTETLGSELQVNLIGADRELIAVREYSAADPVPYGRGQKVLLDFPPERILLFDPETEKRIL